MHFDFSGYTWLTNSIVDFREIIREPAAEFLGTAILVIFGTGAQCQVLLSSNPGVASSPKGVSLCML